MERCLNPLFQDQCSFFCCPHCFEYLNPRYRINKVVKEHTVFSVLTFRIGPHILGGLFRALSLQNIWWVYIYQVGISHHGWRKFSNLWCSKYWKLHFEVKKLNLVIFAQHPRQNSFRGSYHHHPGGTYSDKGEKVTKIKLARVLIISFDNFHHFCMLHNFVYRFSVP